MRGRITPLLALAMMGALNKANLEAMMAKRRWRKPTLVKQEKESRQVRRARERREVQQ